MSDIISLDAAKKRQEENEAWVKSMFGPERRGCDLIVDGRAIPNITVHDCGDRIEFTLDGRFGFEFPREIAPMAASFAAQAMAIGAGYSHLGAPDKGQPFAPQVFEVTLA